MRTWLQPSILILLTANLVPLVGVIGWGWDAFVLLMLYWLETVVIAFWTVLRIATMPRGALGTMQLQEQRGPVSPIGMAAFFSLHAGIFMGAHFMFLWTLFSGDWSRKIHGVSAFVGQMVIGTGLWVPLLVLFIVRGGLTAFDGIKPVLWRKLKLVEDTQTEKSQVGPGETIILGLYLRIAVMQVTIILGAWFALLAGTAGALAFLIVVKTAMDVSYQALVEKIHAALVKAKAQAEKQA